MIAGEVINKRGMQEHENDDCGVEESFGCKLATLMGEPMWFKTICIRGKESAIYGIMG